MVEHRVAEPTEPNRRSRRILVVEDEPSIAGFVRRGLHFEGYDVDVVPDGPGALRRLRDSPPDLLVLDVMVPGIDGFEIARRLRAAETAENSPSIPILMLTARDAVADRVTGLRAGADDYLVKPFDFEELLARIEALRRRAEGAAPAPALGPVRLDAKRRVLVGREREVALTGREFALLSELVAGAGEVHTRSSLLARVWGPTFDGPPNIVDVYVGYLR